MQPSATAPHVGFRAAFAVAAMGVGFVAIFALERVGAPDGLVAALGPLAGLLGIVALGVLTRAKTLLEFMVARRAVAPLYAGLALAAPIGGFALAMTGADADPTRLPWRGAIAGVVLAALIVAPGWRGAQASALADVIATRFPSVFVRTAFAVALTACGWALAASGLGYAALTAQSAFGLNRDAALAICAVVLVLSLAPGGLKSLIWTDAATTAAGLMAMGLFVALSDASAGPDHLQAAGQTLADLPGAPWVQELAAGWATASLFAFAHPAFAAASAGAARRAGAYALIALAGGGAAAATLGAFDVKGPSGAALAGLVAGLPALALARAGLFAAARAFGLDLARAPKRLSVLASRRMAGARGGVLVGAAAAGFAARVSPHPSAPFYLALALWLAFAAPSLLLAALPGRNPAPAIAALGAALAAALAGRYAGFGNPAVGPELLVGALGAGLAGLAAGLAAFVLIPSGRAATPADPFVELPGEG
jgi:Na+/proline symporter